MSLNRLPILPALLLSLPFLAGGTVIAQELELYESFDYGASSTQPLAIDGLDGGAGFTVPWFGVNQTTGLASYWELEDSVLDTGPFQSHGTLVGATYSTDVPPLAWSTKSLQFSSANQDYVDLSAHVGAYANFMRGTISAWFKTSGTGTHVIIAASDSTEPSKEARLMVERGLLIYDVRGDISSYQNLSSVSTVNDGLWHHALVTIDGNGMCSLYLDGFFENASRQGCFRHVFDLDTMAIGRNVDSGGPQWYWDGWLDDIAIWGSALSLAEIQSLANGTAQPSTIAGPNTPLGPYLASESLATPNFPCASFGTFGFEPTGNRFSDATGNRAGRLLTHHLDMRQDKISYISCLLRREDQGTTVVPGEVQFTDTGTIRTRFGWDASSLFVVGITGPDPTTVVMQDRTTYFVVCKVIQSSVSGQDQAFLKIYAPGDTVAADDTGFSGAGSAANNWTGITATTNSNADQDTIWLTQEGIGGVMEVDELRIGTTWQSVTSLGFGAGCLGSQITRLNRPAIGTNDFEVILTGGPIVQPAALYFGLSRDTWIAGPLPFDLTPLGAPGCSILVSLDISLATATNVGGAATSGPIPIPNVTSFEGITTYAQWIALAPGSGNPLPLSLSDGMEILFEK